MVRRISTEQRELYPIVTVPGKVTVLIPTIEGRRDRFVRAVGSVEAQVRHPFMVKISMDKDRIGAAEMKNRMMRQALTEWVAFLDDDDYLLPNHLELLMQAAEEHPECDLFYSWFRAEGREDPLRVPVNGELVSPLGVPFGPEQEEYLMKVDNFIPVTVLLRKDRALAAGGFGEVPGAPDAYDRDDLGLWRRMILNGSRFYHVPEITWVYVFHPGQTGGLGTPEKTT